MGLIKSIHHVSMKCCNDEEYDKVVAFYNGVLGLEIKRTWDNGIMFDAGGQLIEIFRNGQEPMPQGVIRHFAFAVDDVDACVKAVTDAGYEVFMGPKDIEISSIPPLPARMAFCYGPLGEEIEFFHEK